MGGIYWIASYPGSGGESVVKLIHNLIDSSINKAPSNRDEPVDADDLTSGGRASSRRWLDDVLGFETADLSSREVDCLRPTVYGWGRKQKEVHYHHLYDAYTFNSMGEPLLGVKETLGGLYIVRNPVDVVMSFAKQNQISIDQAISRLGDCDHVRCENSPVQVRQKLLSWSAHVLSWVDAPMLSSHVMRYEDLLADPHTVLTDAARFLKLSDEPDRIDQVIQMTGLGAALQAKQRSDVERDPHNTEGHKREDQQRGVHERGVQEKAAQETSANRCWQENDQDRANLTDDQLARILDHHGSVMRRFGYLDAMNRLVDRAPNAVVQAEPAAGSSPAHNMRHQSDVHIDTPRFTLKPLTPSDITDEYIQWWNDEAIQAGLNAPVRGWDRFRVENHVRSHDNRRSCHLGVVRKDGPLVGFADLKFHREGRLADLTLVIGAKAYWGKRVPDEILPRLFDYFFTHFPTEKIKVMIVAPNRSSLAVVKRVGFEHEGVLRQEWHTPSGEPVDVHVYSVLKQDWLQRCEG